EERHLRAGRSAAGARLPGLARARVHLAPDGVVLDVVLGAPLLRRRGAGRGLVGVLAARHGVLLALLEEVEHVAGVVDRAPALRRDVPAEELVAVLARRPVINGLAAVAHDEREVELLVL